ncbi:MAG: hypothetical protein AB1389_08965 [Campylobacterota bacterium]
MEEQIKNTIDKLIQEWFSKLLSGEINNDILLLENTSTTYISELQSAIRQHKENNVEYIIVDEDKQSTKYTTRTNKNLIYVLSPNKSNTKLLATNLIKHNSFLYIPEKHEFYTNMSKYINKDLKNIGNIKIEKRYLYYIEKMDPFDFIMNSTESQLQDFLRFIIFQGCLSWNSGNKFVLMQNYEIAENDLALLKKGEILTARLAILLYKTTMLDVELSKIYIGKYFRAKIGSKSKTFNIKLLNRLGERIKDTNINMTNHVKNFKAYDLKVNESELNIRIEIAKNLITAFLDNKTLDIDNIGKMTNLPKKEVQILKDKLIQKKALLAMASC